MPIQRLPAGRGKYIGQNAYVGQNDSYSFRRDKIKEEKLLAYGMTTHWPGTNGVTNAAQFPDTEIVFYPLCEPQYVITPTTVRMYLAQALGGTVKHYTALYVADFVQNMMIKIPGSELYGECDGSTPIGPKESAVSGFSLYPGQCYFITGFADSAHGKWGGLTIIKYAHPGEHKRMISPPAFGSLPGRVRFDELEDDDHTSSDTFPFITYITEKGKLVI